MTPLITSIADEFRRYKAGGEDALAQVAEPLLSEPGPSNGNSLAVICWHIAGNFQSRFSEFLTTDGEKPTRDREEEFAARSITRDELMAKWELGWNAGQSDAYNKVPTFDKPTAHVEHLREASRANPV